MHWSVQWSRTHILTYFVDRPAGHVRVRDRFIGHRSVRHYRNRLTGHEKVRNRRAGHSRVTVRARGMPKTMTGLPVTDVDGKLRKHVFRLKVGRGKYSSERKYVGCINLVSYDTASTSTAKTRVVLHVFLAAAHSRFLPRHHQHRAVLNVSRYSLINILVRVCESVPMCLLH